MQTSLSNNQTAAVFATTQWNVVFAAAQSQSPGTRDALAQLCLNYWAPLYAFARRQGHSPHDARDIVQGFFASLLASRTYANATPNRGKFRTFLIGGLKHYQSDRRARDTAQKRGGGTAILPLDETTAETQYASSAPSLSPENTFERQWAFTVIDHALASLRAESAESGGAAAFDIMAPFLTGDDLQSRDAACQSLGLTPAAFKAQLHRLRSKFRLHLRRQIAGTVDNPLEIDDEMRHLRSVLNG